MERRPSIFLLLSGFFGLSEFYRVQLFTQIHEIIFHGNGGYTWNEVYNMPIWLRKFTFQKLNEYFEKQNSAVEKSTKSTSKVKGPDIDPTYKTKASKI